MKLYFKEVNKVISDEQSIENIENLEEIVKEYVGQDVDDDVMVSRIMYKVLLFILSNPSNENILHRYCWNYFNKNKDYYMNMIP